MKKIFDQKIINQYIVSTDIINFFNDDVTKVLELFYFQKDEFLIYEGRCSDYIYFLADGKLRVYSSIGNGKIMAHGSFPFFRVLGETSCLWGDAAMATVQCEKDSYCFGISLTFYRNLLLNDVKFLRYICNILRTQMTSLCEDSHTSYFPLENRLSSFILQYSEDGVLNYNLVTCADLLSVSYRHLIRVMGSFCRLGYIHKIGRGKYRIVDQASLIHLASLTMQST